MSQPSNPRLRTHRCPAFPCEARVSNSILACPADWARLTPETQAAIYRTARLPILSVPRRAALDAAMAEWRAAR
jgi:hypothetical protein